MIKNKVSMSVLTAFIQHSAESSSHCNKARKATKRHTDRKGKNKTLREDDMIIYVENLKESTPKSPNS